jgi:hypothetical protein
MVAKCFIPATSAGPNGFTTTYQRTELGEIYRTTGPAPYQFQVETQYDANRNTIRVDTQDQQVRFDSPDPTLPGYGQVSPQSIGPSGEKTKRGRS